MAFLTRTGLSFAALLPSACCIPAFPTARGYGSTTAAMEQGLQGHVKSVRVEESGRSGSSRTFAERSILSRLRIYQGRCVGKETHDSDGESEGSTTYEYGSRGDLTRETVYSSADSPVFAITDRTYGPDHRLLLKNQERTVPVKQGHWTPCLRASIAMTLKETTRE
jgi:hypothetical protein